MKTMKRKILLACVENQAYKKMDVTYDNPVSITLECQLKNEPSDYWAINCKHFNPVAEGK
jgi:hypothetical protein